jgi:PAS domain S-box-containing protein
MDKKQIQVLLLEDEAAHAEAIRRALESSDSDLKLHVVGSIKGFRDYIAADTPDIAVVDMALPDGNGIDLLTYPPESKAFPMLILTSHGNEKVAVDALKAGALDYVVKSPETFAAMSRILTRNLNQWSLIQERKKAEAALQESEQNFRNSLEGSLVGIYIADEDWQPTFANKAFLDIFDYANMDEVKTSPPHERYTPESLADLAQREDRYLYGQPIPNQIEVAITRKDSSIRHLHIFHQEIFWDGKKQHQLFYSDITERVQAEAALQETEITLHNFLDNSVMGVRIREGDNILYLNQAFLDIFGYQNIEEAKLTSPLKSYTPESYADYLERAEKISRGETVSHKIGVDIIRKDGTIRHLQVYGKNTVRNQRSQGQTIYNDITELKKVEKSLHENELKYRTLFETANDAILLFTDNHWVDCNAAALSTYGCTREQIIGSHPSRLSPPIQPDGRSSEEGSIEKINLAYTVGPQFFEWEHCRKDGTLFSAEVSLNRLDIDGKPYMQSIVRDITERKKTETALLASEERFRLLAESALVGVYILQDGKYLYANPAMARIFGYSVDELIGMTPHQIVQPLDHAMVDKNIQRRIDGEVKDFQNEAKGRYKDGSPRDVEVHGSRVEINGKPALIGTLIDITERKRAESTLRQSENKYRELTESISDVFFAMDNDLRYTHWNKASEKLTGILAADALGRRLSDIFPENEATRNLQEMYLKAIRTQQSQHFISKYPGGKNKIHEITIYPTKDGISVFTKDITERIQMEDVLRESELRFRTLIEKAPIAIDISRDGKVLYANKKLVELMRESNPEKNVGRPVIDFFVPELREESQTLPKLHSSGLPAPENFESKLQREDGSQIPVQIQRSQLQLSDGMANIAFITDITERKDAENKRHQIEEKAQITSRLASVGEMAAGIAHEINNPLTAVLGFSQIILEGKNVPEDIRENITIIANESQRVANIVRRLLTFARQTKPVKTSVNLNEVIDNTLKLRQYVLKTANISAITNYDPELPCLVVDPGQMQQVFLNLIVNAEQAMKKAHGKGILKITTEKKDNYIRISFRDDGPGITKENMGHLFEPFFTTKDIGEGTGLGLSLSRSIILEHGGKMSVESESGLGATFIVELPVVDAAPPGPENACAITEIQPSPEKSGRILVVDDEPGIRALLEKVLTQIGYIVDTITNPKIVKDKLNAGERYDAILLDIRMPGMSGTELYSHIIENMPVLKGKIIIITGDVMGPDIKDFLTKNNLPYLVKPFDIKLLKEKINEIIGSGQSVA